MDNHSTQVRLAILEAGGNPTPTNGKRAFLPGWTEKLNVTPDEVRGWPACNTGQLANYNPGVDIDILDPIVVDALANLIRDRFGDDGEILERTGQAPKVLFVFRTDTPFNKMEQWFTSPSGEAQHIEILGRGQQYVVDGIHPDTKQPYVWRDNRAPWHFGRDELPSLTEETARELLEDMSDLLVKEFGYTLGKPQAPTNGDARVDIDAQLASMYYRGKGDNNVNEVRCKVVPSMFWAGYHPAEIHRRFADRVMEVGGADFKEMDEERQTRASIISSFNFLVEKHPRAGSVPPPWVPGEFHTSWVRICSEGKTPRLHYGGGVYSLRQRENRREDHVAPPQQEAAAAPRKTRFKIMKFSDLKLGEHTPGLVEELLPLEGLAVVWGKQKSLKSFLMLNIMLHVAKGWEFRGRQVTQGPVVYCAFEGGFGFAKRKEAMWRQYGLDVNDPVPLYLMAGGINLINEHPVLGAEIEMALDGQKPVAVVLDTLNRSLVGSENRDVDMAAYIRAAEAIRDKFCCIVIIVHHCGYNEERLRGHSSLPAAVDAQLAVRREGNIVSLVVENMRDGPEGAEIISEVEIVEVGQDAGGKPLTSLIVKATEATMAGTSGKYLAPLMAALNRALTDHGQPFSPEAGSYVLQAVAQGHVREEFYATYNIADEDGDNDASRGRRKNKLRMAFTRAMEEAQATKTINVRQGRDGVPMVWKANI
jgi:hypothetical protein